MGCTPVLLLLIVDTSEERGAFAAEDGVENDSASVEVLVSLSEREVMICDSRMWQDAHPTDSVMSVRCQLSFLLSLGLVRSPS